MDVPVDVVGHVRTPHAPTLRTSAAGSESGRNRAARSPAVPSGPAPAPVRGVPTAPTTSWAELVGTPSSR
jgi:hypothetical protein